MPKVKKNVNSSRVARRRIATENLPLPATDNFAVQIKNYNKHVPPIERESTFLDKKAIVIQSKCGNNHTTEDVNHNDTDNHEIQKLSRGQRKRHAKREQFLRKEKMILSSLMLQRQEEQKKRIDGLDAIKQALMNATVKNKNDGNSEKITRKPEPNHVSTNKAKRKLVAKEIEHVNLILQHPAFKKNPFETMQEHLRNTFSEDRKQQEFLSKKRTEEEKRKVETRRVDRNVIKKKARKKKYKPRRTR